MQALISRIMFVTGLLADQDMADGPFTAANWLGSGRGNAAAAVTCFAGIVMWVYLIIENRRKAQKLRLPPGPRGWPLIGHLHLMGAHPQHSLMKLAKTYGPVMFLKLGSVKTVVVSSPEMAREVLRIQDEVFCSRPLTLSGEILFRNNQDIAFTPVNEHFRIMRRMCSEEMLSAKCIEKFQDSRREVLLRSVQNLLAEGRDGKPVELWHNLHEMSFNTAARMLYDKTFYGKKATGTDASGAPRDFHLLGREWDTMAAQFIPAEFFPVLRKLDLGGFEAAFRRIRKDFDDFFDTILEEHRQDRTSGQEPKRKTDFVDVLLSAQEQNDGKSLTDVQIRCVLQNMMIGGTDTSAAQTHWTIAELMRHPEILAKVTAELDEVVGRTRFVAESDLQKLPYLRAVVRESFRLHPTAPLLVPHESQADATVAGFFIPNRTRILVNVYAISRDPDVWHNPLDFEPRRFLDSSVDLKGQDFQFLPFGSGRRKCPGLNLGLRMVEFSVAQLLHACHFSLPHGVRPQDVDVTEAVGIVVDLANPIKLLASPRLPSLVYVNG